MYKTKLYLIGYGGEKTWKGYYFQVTLGLVRLPFFLLSLEQKKKKNTFRWTGIYVYTRWVSPTRSAGPLDEGTIYILSSSYGDPYVLFSGGGL